MRIAMISEHASPLAALGGVDAGGQNAHVAELSAALAAAGPRGPRLHPPGRTGPAATWCRWRAASTSCTCRPGRRSRCPRTSCCRTWATSPSGWPRTGAATWRPDVAHAHFWMSGLAAVTAGRACDVPVVQTFHALGSVKRRHQGAADTSPPQRIAYERQLGRAVDRVVVQCQDEIRELVQLGVPRGAHGADPVRGEHRAVPPGRPGRSRAAPARRGSSPSAGWSSARASRT